MGRMKNFDATTRRLAREALGDQVAIVRVEPAEVPEVTEATEATEEAGAQPVAPPRARPSLPWIGAFAGIEFLILAAARRSRRPGAAIVLGLAIASAAGWFALRRRRRAQRSLATTVVGASA